MRLTGGRIVLAAGAVLWGLVGGGPGRAEAAGGESAFVGLTPCRLADTRGNGFAGAFGPPALAAGVARDFPVQGQCGVPVGALAISLNVTATATQGPGFLLLYPQGSAQPLVSTLNYVGGETVANAAIVPLGAGGLTVIAGVSGTDLILDVNGYFADSLVHENESSLAVGPRVLGNSTGNSNVGVGPSALSDNLSGEGNIAAGDGALRRNTSGSFNTALGTGTLETNETGRTNTAVGYSALSQNTVGSFNAALGYQAGVLTTGSANIVIGHPGVPGENATIRIGIQDAGPFQPGHTAAFIGGIFDVSPAGGDQRLVIIDSQGQLGARPRPLDASGEDRHRGHRGARPGAPRAAPGELPLPDEAEWSAGVWADRRGGGRGLAGAGAVGRRRRAADGTISAPPVTPVERAAASGARDGGEGPGAPGHARTTHGAGDDGGRAGGRGGPAEGARFDGHRASG
jgi:hypothetical protein